MQDENGNDLLNPATEGCIADNGIKAICGDVEYKKDSVIIGTRDYLPTFTGLQTIKTTEGRYLLTIGEFDGNGKYTDYKILLDWDDGTSDELSFSNSVTWKGNEPEIARSFYLNGTKQEGSLFTITK